MKKLVFVALLSVMMVFTMIPMVSFAVPVDTIHINGLKAPVAGETPICVGVTADEDVTKTLHG